jgi:purine-nucleoside phosphorylase
MSHFSLTKGANGQDEEFGTRFPPLSDAYDLSLRQAFFAASRHPGSSLQRSIHEGVYAFVGGPTYETRAECRMLRMLGADLVGMSTVPEIVVARHCGIRVLGISLVTNEAVLAPVPSGKDEAQGQAGADAMTKGMANHEEVLEAGRAAALDMQACVASVVNGL